MSSEQDRTIGIAIPTYNRFALLFNSFERVYNNVNVQEITIVDDCSNIEIYNQVEERAKDYSKIRLFRNTENLDCYRNKYQSLLNSTQQWNILLDSDNEINFDYLFHLLQIIEWEEKTAYLPSKALPHFDYSRYEGLTITKENVHKYIEDPTFQCMLNTANYFVDREFYLECFDNSINPHTSDSVYMNYLWLKNGGKLYVVPQLTYKHRVDDHEGEEKGHYNTNNHKTGNFHEEVLNKLKYI